MFIQFCVAGIFPVNEDPLPLRPRFTAVQNDVVITDVAMQMLALQCISNRCSKQLSQHSRDDPDEICIPFRTSAPALNNSFVFLKWLSVSPASFDTSR